MGKEIYNSRKELPCAACVFVYIFKPGSCFLAFQFEELRCSSNQISCACLESVQSSIFDSFKFNITSPSYHIKCVDLCTEATEAHFLLQKTKYKPVNFVITQSFWIKN